MTKLPPLTDGPYWRRALRNGEHEALGLRVLVGLVAPGFDGVGRDVEEAVVYEIFRLATPVFRARIGPDDFSERAREILRIAGSILLKAVREPSSDRFGHLSRAPADALKVISYEAICEYRRTYADAVKIRDPEEPAGPSRGGVRRKTVERSVLDVKVIDGAHDLGLSASQAIYNLMVSQLLRLMPERMRPAARLRMELRYTWDEAADVGEAGVSGTALRDAFKKALTASGVDWKANLDHAMRRKAAEEDAKAERAARRTTKRSCGRQPDQGGEGDGEDGTSPGEDER